MTKIHLKGGAYSKGGAYWKESAKSEQGGGGILLLRTFLCDIAVPGNRACVVETEWLLRENKRNMLVITIINGKIEFLRNPGI